MEVIIITGACGVGKSTIAKEWAKSKNGAIIECDYFTEWIYQADFPRWTLEEEKLVVSLTVATAKEYLKRRMPVAIENVWSPDGIRLLVNKFRKQKSISALKVIWLVCDLEENHRRDRLRLPEDQMKERVAIVNQELKSYEWPSYVQIVDSTGLNVTETLQLIEDLSPKHLP